MPLYPPSGGTIDSTPINALLKVDGSGNAIATTEITQSNNQTLFKRSSATGLFLYDWNTNSGNGAFCELNAQNDLSGLDGTISVGITSSTYTVSGLYGPSTTYILGESAASLIIACTAGQAIVFSDDLATTERVRIDAGLMVGTSTDPGAGIINVLTGYRIGNSATSGKILKGNGSSFVASTETYATPGTSGNLMTSDGTNWASTAPPLGTPTVSKVTGSDFQTNSTALINITGLTFATASNKTYLVESWLRGQSTTTAGVKFTMAFSGANATGEYLATLHATSSVGGVNANILGGNTNSGTWSTANTDSLAYFTGTVTTKAAAGNIVMQVAKVTGGNVNIYMGSLMSVTLING